MPYPNPYDLSRYRAAPNPPPAPQVFAPRGWDDFTLEPEVPGPYPQGRNSPTSVEARSNTAARIVPYTDYLRDVEGFRQKFQTDPTSVYPEWEKVKHTRKGQVAASILPYAAALQKGFGIPASDTITRMMHETGVGTSGLWRYGNALGGVKSSGWSGPKIRGAGGNVYRAYDTREESFYNYANLLNRPFYSRNWKPVLQHEFSDLRGIPAAAVRSLHFSRAVLRSGYCPDSGYLHAQLRHGTEAGVWSIDAAVSGIHSPYSPMPAMLKRISEYKDRVLNKAIASDPTGVLARTTKTYVDALLGGLPSERRSRANVATADFGGVKVYSPFRKGKLKVTSWNRRSSGAKHTALDLSIYGGSQGAEIYAMLDAEVIGISDSNGGIITTMTKDSSGRPIVPRYVHVTPTRDLVKRFKAAQSSGTRLQIKAGEKIGALLRRGTGGWTGFHLHFDIGTMGGDKSRPMSTVGGAVQWLGKAVNVFKTNLDKIGQALASGAETAYIDFKGGFDGNLQDLEDSGDPLRPMGRGGRRGPGGPGGGEGLYEPMGRPYVPDLGGMDPKTAHLRGPSGTRTLSLSELFISECEAAHAAAADSLALSLSPF